MRTKQLTIAIVLVAGLPIGLFLWGLAEEWSTLGMLGNRNPLPSVANDLMERVDQRMDGAAGVLLGLATDPDLSSQAGLDRYRHWVTEGVFLALALVPESGPGVAIFSDDVTPRLAGDGPLALDWQRLPTSVDNIPPVWTVSGRPVVTLRVPLSADRPQTLVGLVDLNRLLGKEQLSRMKLARWGEAFLVEPSGRIFVSAHANLVGRYLGELGWADGTTPATKRWQDETGTDMWVALASAHPAHIGPQQGWRAGLVVPTAVVAARSDRFRLHLTLVMLAVAAITFGMAWVLRRSIKGPRRSPGLTPQ